MTPLPMGKSLREAFGEALAEIGEREPRLVVLDGDLGSSTRADIFEAAHPERFYQMGIAEQNLVGAAAGMATLGLIPYVSTFACFAVARALDSIRVLIAQTNLNVKITGGYAGLLAGMTGKTHLMFNDIAVMRSLAGVAVVSPADEFETRSALEVITDHVGPVYIRLSRPDTPIVFGDSYEFVLGKAVVIRDGTDVALISTGTQTARALEAAEVLDRRASRHSFSTSRPSSRSTRTHRGGGRANRTRDHRGGPLDHRRARWRRGRIAVLALPDARGPARNPGHLRRVGAR